MPYLAIQESIQELLTAYREHPLLLLREHGKQRRLASLIQNRLAQPLCPVRVVQQVRRPHFDYETTDRMERVQTEICVRLQDDDKRKREVSDIVVLGLDEQQPVRLMLRQNGHLDIVQSISARHLAAVIEVKAACSADPSERHKFRLDVKKLLSLATHVAAVDGWIAPEMHFVLIDKSLSVGAHNRSRGKPKRHWFTETEAELATWTKIGREKHWLYSPRINMHDAHPPINPFAHVWTLEQREDGSAGDRVTHQYATLPPQQ